MIESVSRQDRPSRIATPQSTESSSCASVRTERRVVNHSLPSWNQVRGWLLELEKIRMGYRQGCDGRLGAFG